MIGPSLDVARLWLSYQRYALLLVVLVVAGAVAIAAIWPGAWWPWLLAAWPAFRAVTAARDIAGRWPRKLRATALADRRIAAGRFSPRSVAGHCGDPCFRVVANEILRRAGIAGPERRRLIRELARERAIQPGVTVLVDRSGGRLVRVNGDRIDDSPIPRTDPT